MDYDLCIPSIHAFTEKGDVIMTIGGHPGLINGDFPDEDIQILCEWVKLHKKEIVDNHLRRGHNIYPLLPILPPQK